MSEPYDFGKAWQHWQGKPKINDRDRSNGQNQPINFDSPMAQESSISKPQGQILKNDIESSMSYHEVGPSSSDNYDNAIVDNNDIKSVNITDSHDGLSDCLFNIMMNEHGSCVFTTFINRCDESQLENIVDRLVENPDEFVILVCNKHGAHAVKHLIKTLEKSPLLSKITSLLVKKFKILMSNRIASFVIIKCFQILKIDKNKELYESLVYHAIKLATNDTSYLTLNESINYVRQPYRDQLFHKIATHARHLSQDPLGNYVVQKVLGIMYNTEIEEMICNSLKGYFVELSNQKASSHVVEKCLESESVGINYVLHDFLNDDNLWRVARNQYGNYVVQKALKFAEKIEGSYHELLVKKLYKDKEKFQNGYGKNVYAIIIQQMMNYDIEETLVALAL